MENTNAWLTVCLLGLLCVLLLAVVVGVVSLFAFIARAHRDAVTEHVRLIRAFGEALNQSNTQARKLVDRVVALSNTQAIEVLKAPKKAAATTAPPAAEEPFDPNKLEGVGMGRDEGWVPSDLLGPPRVQ